MVILDRMGSDVLKKMVLGDIDLIILPVRMETIYVAPLIIFNLVKNLITIRKTDNEKPKSFIFRRYLLACMQFIRPKVVVTFIDNNLNYQALSRLNKSVTYYYVMNGTRSAWELDTENKFSMTNLLCWGRHDIDYYESFGHQVDCYHPVGPLISGYYKTNIERKTPPIKYDICIVSQYRSEIMAGLAFPTFKDAVVLLDQYLNKFLEGKDLSVCVATCSINKADLSREIAYYEETYEGHVDIIEQNREEYSTYRAMDESELIITIHS
ncbi:MAG: hypothetical protein ACM3QW_07500, partial [Ignavibacteriales bacterium]